MMRKRVLTAALCLLTAGTVALLAAGCDVVSGNGRVETRNVRIERALTGVVNSGSFDVIIDPSLTGKAVLTGESNILDLLDVGQSAGGVFTVAFKRGVIPAPQQTVEVRVPAVPGGFYEINGSGNVTQEGSGPLVGNAFELRVNGSGNIDLNLECARLKTGIAGMGNVDLKGKADALEASITGSGNINAFDCKAVRADIRIVGSGDASVQVTDTLKTSIIGAGNVVYKGEPKNVTVDGAGSGKVQKQGQAEKGE